MDVTIRVAVCDDAPAVKMFYRQVLEEDGDMEVVSTASSGREAVVELGRHRPDALLLDLILPDVADPSALMRDLRECSPGTAIVLISNLPPSDLAQEAERLGADAWMPKAQKPDAVRAGVRAAVPRAD